MLLLPLFESCTTDLEKQMELYHQPTYQPTKQPTNQSKPRKHFIAFLASFWIGDVTPYSSLGNKPGYTWQLSDWKKEDANVFYFLKSGIKMLI